MSMYPYAYVGYGISTAPFKYATNEGIVKVLELTSEKTRKSIGKIDEAVDIDRIEYDCDGDPFGLGGLVADAMSCQEDIYFTHASTDDDNFIIFEPYYPWYKPRTNEATLTEEKLVDLFYKYQTMLGIPKDKQERANYQVATGYC